MSFEGFRTDGTVDRRIGRRAPARPLEVTWLVPRSGRFTLRRAPREHPGTVEDVSLTGAAILGPASMPFEVESSVLVRYQGFETSVIVRRREPTLDPEMHLYGVEMAVVHPLLQQAISDRLAARRGPTSGTAGAPGTPSAF